MMRRALILTFAVLSARLGLAQQSPLDDVVREFRLPTAVSSCGIASVLAQLARQTSAVAGFERPPDCVAFPHFDPNAPSYDLSGLTARDILDRLMIVVSGYSWRDVNGRAVVRRTAAWNDKQDIFNRWVPAIHIADATVPIVASAILKLPSPDPRPRPMFDFNFTGGTIIDALNTLVASSPLAMWDTELFTHRPNDASPTVMLHVRSLTGGLGFSIATPLPRLLETR